MRRQRTRKAGPGNLRFAGPIMATLLACAAIVPAASADEQRCGNEIIGVATMAADGEIMMRVRSLPPGPIAESTFSYRPADPQYESVKQHLGGIAPGESKPVPRWC